MLYGCDGAVVSTVMLMLYNDSSNTVTLVITMEDGLLGINSKEQNVGEGILR